MGLVGDSISDEGKETNMPSSVDPVSAVQQYIDGFNKGDLKAMATMRTDPMSILDGMVPHVWHGPTVCQDSYSDVLVEGEHAGAKDDQVTLTRALHANATGDAARHGR
jgi:hypothetical protein